MSEIAKLLLLGVVASCLNGCGSGDKGKAIASQANGAAEAAEAPVLNRIDRSHAGQSAPVVAFEVRGGGKQTLADFKGKRVLVNLWATWCAPCIAEMPELDAMAGARQGKLAVLPISQDMEGWRVVDKFFAKAKFKTLEPRLDQPGSLAEALKAKGLPMSVLYDAQGREVWRVAGVLKWRSPEVSAAL